MVEELRNENVPIFVVNLSLCRQGRRILALKWWGGDSWVTRLPSKAAVGRGRRVLYDVKCHFFSWSFQVAGVGGRYSSVCLCLLSVWTLEESHILPSTNQIWSFFIFYREGLRLVEKLLLINFF